MLHTGFTQSCDLRALAAYAHDPPSFVSELHGISCTGWRSYGTSRFARIRAKSSSVSDVCCFTYSSTLPYSFAITSSVARIVSGL